MADGLDIERLIGEVDQRHHVLLTSDDPVLVTVTLNDILLARALTRLTSAVDSADLRIAAGADRHIALAKEIAAQLINGAADYADKVIRDAAKDSADRIIETCRSQLAVEAKNESAARGSHASAWSATIVAVSAAIVAAALVIIYPLTSGQSPPPERCIPSVNLPAQAEPGPPLLTTGPRWRLGRPPDGGRTVVYRAYDVDWPCEFLPWRNKIE